MMRVGVPDIDERVVTPLGRVAKVVAVDTEPARRTSRGALLRFVRVAYHDTRLPDADLAVSALRGYDGPLLLFQDETARLLRRYGLSIATDGTP